VKNELVGKSTRTRKTYFQVEENSEISMKFWNFVPNDVLTEIFSFLGLRSILKVSCVCKKWREIVTQKKILSKIFNKWENYINHLDEEISMKILPMEFLYVEIAYTNEAIQLICDSILPYNRHTIHHHSNNNNNEQVKNSVENFAFIFQDENFIKNFAKFLNLHGETKFPNLIDKLIDFPAQKISDYKKNFDEIFQNLTKFELRIVKSWLEIVLGKIHKRKIIPRKIFRKKISFVEKYLLQEKVDNNNIDVIVTQNDDDSNGSQ
jgi:hypothetical protein